MLWNASSIRGYSVFASGELVGTVKDFVFDELAWTIAGLLVDTGSWLSSKVVHVPVSAFGQPVAETKQITLKSAPGSLADSPDGEADRIGAGLRALAPLDKATVEGSDEHVGSVVDYLIDTAGWRIRYLVINPSDPLSEERVLVPVQTVATIDYPGATLTLTATHRFVRESLHYDPNQTVDGAYDESFLTYYGIRFVKK